MFKQFPITKADLSTRSGTASVAPTSTPGDLDGEELGDDELARLEQQVDSELEAMMSQPEHVIPVCDDEEMSTPPPQQPPVKPEPEVTGNLAKGLDDGILPGDLYDARVEDMITMRFNKLDEKQFQRLLESAPVHPDYDTYCRGVRVEHGLENEEDWAFGRDEPFLDMVGLHCWSFSRQQLRDRLALGELTEKVVGKEKGMGDVGGGGGVPNHLHWFTLHSKKQWLPQRNLQRHLAQLGKQHLRQLKRPQALQLKRQQAL